MLCPLLLLAAFAAIDIDKRTLPNGLEVILSEDHRLPVVAVNIVYHVGAIDEPRSRTGFAHLYEHLMFQGSAHVADEAHFQRLSEAGAGTVNAETGFDFTEYYETVPSNQLPLALWLESDRMASLLVDQRTLDVQREVVKNERRQDVEDAPYGRLQEALLKALYPATHPYSDGIIGSMAHLSAATLSDARTFFIEHYTPANATLAIVGDFDKKETLRLVEEYFGGIHGAKKPVHKTPLLPEKPAQARFEIDEPIGRVPKIVVAWVSAPFGHEDDVALEAWADILAGGKAGRLYRTLVTDLALAQDVDAGVDALAGGSMFEITVTPLQGVTANALEKATLAAIDQAFATAPTDAELKRVIARNETLRLIDIESPGGDDGLANLLQLFNHYTGDPQSYARELERYQALTPAKLLSASKRWLTPQRRVIGIAKPVAAKTNVQPSTPPPRPAKPRALAKDRKQPPVWPEPSFALPLLQRADLDNGFSVYVAEDHALPLVAVSIAIDASDAANLIAWMAEGAAGKNAAQLDEAFGLLGTSLDAHSSRDGAALQTIVTSDRVDAATSLLADLFLRPTLAGKELDALKKRMLSAREELLSDAFSLGMETLSAVLFPGHPYGKPLHGTSKTIASLDAETLRKAYNAKMGSASLVLVGDITPARGKELAQKFFGALAARAERVAPTPALPASFQTVQLREKAGLGQTFIGVGVVAVPFSDPDRVALDLANDVFAGLFNSRLNLRLREDLAITYGASGANVSMRQAGAFLAVAQVNQDATGRGLKETLALVDGMTKKPATAAELQSAKLAALRSLPGRFTHRFDTASAFASLLAVGAQGDVFAKLPQEIGAVTLEKVRRATAKYFNRKHLQVVLVGELALVRASLGNLLPVEPFTLDE